ncbi:hypothetical protein H4219_004261 [Mycoemilia scoparia]|uniref:Aminotransferase class I/classII large domain-containing protein n=1 Tax=Mycoemilia scoparia TaxID=417184 RepID=A0A9W8DLR5_9FUNG|nr:hypothetical protein H4219_004261 [Mycoemilia scoparia]
MSLLPATTTTTLDKENTAIITNNHSPPPSSPPPSNNKDNVVTSRHSHKSSGDAIAMSKDITDNHYGIFPKHQHSRVLSSVSSVTAASSCDEEASSRLPSVGNKEQQSESKFVNQSSSFGTATPTAADTTTTTTAIAIATGDNDDGDWKEIEPSTTSYEIENPILEFMVKAFKAATTTTTTTTTHRIHNNSINNGDDGRLVNLAMGDPTAHGLKTGYESPISKEIAKIVNSAEFNGYNQSTGVANTREYIASLYDLSKSHHNQGDDDDDDDEGVVNDVSSGCYKPTKDDVIMTSGVSGGLVMLFSALCNKAAATTTTTTTTTTNTVVGGGAGAGDNNKLREDIILIPRPGFSYETIATSCGIKTIYYDLDLDNNGQVNIEYLRNHIREIKYYQNCNIRGILINNPSNPLGTNFSKSHICDLVHVCQDFKIPIICDQIYERVCYSLHDNNHQEEEEEEEEEEEKFVSVHEIGVNYPKVPIFILSGISKLQMLPGSRIGWIVLWDPQNLLGKVRKSLLSWSTILNGPNVQYQAAVPQILEITKTPGYIHSVIEPLVENVQYLVERIGRIRGLDTPIVPNGAVYLYVRVDLDQFHRSGCCGQGDDDDGDGWNGELKSDKDFCLEFAKLFKTLVVPGSCFGGNSCGEKESGRGSAGNFVYFRLFTFCPKDVLIVAMDRLERFCRLYY